MSPAKKSSVELHVWRQKKSSTTGDWEVHTVDSSSGGSLLKALKGLNAAGAKLAFNGQDESENQQTGLLVNGAPMLATNVELSDLSSPVYLEPFQSFAVIQDLQVDLSPLKRDLDAVDRLSPQVLRDMDAISTCLRCGVCQEACPDYSGDGNYMGPAPVVLLDWGNHAPGGEVKRKERLALLVSDRGVHHDRTGFAFDGACPNELSLRRSMARAKRDASWHWLRSALEQ